MADSWGVAQFARRPRATAADMAILVADAWLRQDFGAQLITSLARLAQAKGICHGKATRSRTGLLSCSIGYLGAP